MDIQYVHLFDTFVTVKQCSQKYRTRTSRCNYWYTPSFIIIRYTDMYNRFAVLFFILSALAFTASATSTSSSITMHHNSRLLKGKNNLLQIRGGLKKDTSILRMIKAFWLTLIDPNNEEVLNAPDKNKSKISKTKQVSSTKGRSLKD